MGRLFSFGFLIVAIIVAGWFVVESQKDVTAAARNGGGGGGGGRPGASAEQAPLVQVKKIEASEISTTREYIGRVEAINSVDLVARVSGYLESINFEEGRFVKAGDIMFTIEKAEYLAEIEKQSGAIAQIRANLVQADKYLARLESASRESVPEKDIEMAQRNVDFYQAQLDSAKASLDLAQLELEYTTVRPQCRDVLPRKTIRLVTMWGPVREPSRQLCSLIL